MKTLRDAILKIMAFIGFTAILTGCSAMPEIEKIGERAAEDIIKQELEQLEQQKPAPIVEPAPLAEPAPAQ